MPGAPPPTTSRSPGTTSIATERSSPPSRTVRPPSPTPASHRASTTPTPSPRSTRQPTRAPFSAGWTGAATSDALSTTYAYDAENRLTSLTQGGSSIGAYAYDGAGDRVAKTTSSGTTAYTLDLASSLPQVISETTGSTTSFTAFAGGPLELDQAGTTYWYQTDTLGSVRLLTDASGNQASSYNYSAFGQTRTSSGSIANEVRFTGERTDTESGLEFLRARTYDPSTGTFLSRDSWGITPTDGQSLDLYGYTQNSPVNAIDPSGHVTLNCRYGREDCDNGISPSVKAAMPPVNATAKSSSKPKLGSNIAGGQSDKPADCGFNPLCHLGNGYSSTVGNNVVNNGANFARDTFGLKYDATIGGCINGDLTLLSFVQVGGQACALAATSGQLGLTASGGGSVGPVKVAEPDWSSSGGKVQIKGGPSLIFTNNSGNIGDQKGWFTNAGIGGYYLGGASGELQQGTGRCGQTFFQGEFGIGPGIGGGFGVGRSNTIILWTSKGDQPCD